MLYFPPLSSALNVPALYSILMGPSVRPPEGDWHAILPTNVFILKVWDISLVDGIPMDVDKSILATSIVQLKDLLAELPDQQDSVLRVYIMDGHDIGNEFENHLQSILPSEVDPNSPQPLSGPFSESLHHHGSTYCFSPDHDPSEPHYNSIKGMERLASRLILQGAIICLTEDRRGRIICKIYTKPCLDLPNGSERQSLYLIPLNAIFPNIL